ncbi:MAG: hypothetical protein QF558_02070 [Acidimicrobiales bacterium]|jgi:hypothetical protein|nr:hypothetical protein [Acidimicrobiales bacterium]
MKRRLAQLLARPPAGGTLPNDWIEQEAARLDDVTSGIDLPLRLTHRQVDDVLACGAKWLAKAELPDTMPTAWTLRRELIRQAATEWIEASLAGTAPQPHHFVESLLHDDGRLDPLTTTYLLVLGDYARTELTGLIVGAICRLDSAWPTLAQDQRIHLGPALPEYRSNGVTLVSDLVDLTVGWHTADGNSIRPGSVLVHLEPDATHPHLLDRMLLDTVVHGLAAGAPPTRLVGLGLTHGGTVWRDLTPDHWDTAAAAVRLAIRRIHRARTRLEVTVDGGPHCNSCPDKDECDLSEFEPDDPF